MAPSISLFDCGLFLRTLAVFAAVLASVSTGKMVEEGIEEVIPGGDQGKIEHVSDHDLFPRHGRCQAVTISFCSNMPYNSTLMPNIFGHQNQEEAGMEMHQFFPLVKVNCSKDLQFFLCCVYIPVCTILEVPIPPCRPLCLSAKNGCETLMNKFGFQWPESLDCNKFPEGPHEKMCVDENTMTTEGHGGPMREGPDGFPINAPDWIENSSDKMKEMVEEGTEEVIPKGDQERIELPFNSSVHSLPVNCENITVPLCVDVFYTQTSMPNMLGHESQEEAGLEVRQFFPSVKMGCSASLPLFLCSVYVPPCSAEGKSILPCRSLCISAQQVCLPLMHRFGFMWPESLDCNKFPEQGISICLTNEGVQDIKGNTDAPNVKKDAKGSSIDSLSKPNAELLSVHEKVNELNDYFSSPASRLHSEKLFLCSSFISMCSEGSGHAACKRLCQSFKNICEITMLEGGLKWPESWDCVAPGSQTMNCTVSQVKPSKKNVERNIPTF